jgi:hypothetical protein
LVDGSGYLHISYYNATYGDLKYAYKDVSGWHTETADGGASVGLYSSLAIDGSGYPHVTYYAEANGDLKYGRRDGLGWHLETVDATGAVGRHTSVALDTSGYPHVSYYDETNMDLKYAYWDGSDWQIEIVDNDGGTHTSLALDGVGYPHISYYDATYYRAKYAHKDASGWHARPVDNRTGFGEWTSLALDGTGHVHISYYGNGDLFYAYGVPAMNLSGRLMGDELLLTWTAVPGTSEYWLYGASNLAHFDPGSPPGPTHKLVELLQGTTTWSSANGVGDPGNNWTYMVVAMNASNQELLRTNRIGEHDFDTGAPAQVPRVQGTVGRYGTARGPRDSAPLLPAPQSPPWQGQTEPLPRTGRKVGIEALPD